MHVIFLHGLESGPHGSKFHALVDAGFQVIAPDFRGKNLVERVNETTQLLQDNPGAIVVGSSYGGITAVLSTMRSAVKPKAMVLCAPALERDEAPNTEPLKLKALCPTIIVHGTNDDVIPLNVSIRFVQRCPSVTLVKVNDGHRLGAEISKEAIVSAVRELI